MKFNAGQSIVEVVFATGIIMMVVTGVVALIITSLGSRTKSLDRNRAVELSQIVMEGIVKTKESDPVSFWDIGSVYWVNIGKSSVDNTFPGYVYSATPVVYSGNGCSNTVTECLNVSVIITWKGSNVNNQYNRFFSRK